MTDHQFRAWLRVRLDNLSARTRFTLRTRGEKRYSKTTTDIVNDLHKIFNEAQVNANAVIKNS